MLEQPIQCPRVCGREADRRTCVVSGVKRREEEEEDSLLTGAEEEKEEEEEGKSLFRANAVNEGGGGGGKLFIDKWSGRGEGGARQTVTAGPCP